MPARHQRLRGALLPLLLEVALLHVRQLLQQALDLVLVLIDLSLVHVKLSGHGLHLSGLLLEILLVDRELFGNLGTGLSGKEVLKFNVELLLLLDEHIFLADLFGLGNQALLQRLDLLDEFVGLGVRALELPPAMHIQGQLKLVSEELGLLFLLEQLFL